MAIPGKKALQDSSASTPTTTSDEDLQVYCQPCDEEGIRLLAHGYCTDCKEHLCRDCFKFHKKNKLTKRHILHDAKNMPMFLQQTTIDNLTTPYTKHPKEMIKFYCHTHEELLCVCVTLKHTGTSCKINYIPEISGEILDSKVYQETLKAVKNYSDIYTEITRDVKNMTEKSNTSLKDVLRDINKFRQEINERLDELERKAKEAAKVIEQDNNDNLKTVETTCDTTIKSLQTLSDTIKQLNISKQADKLFLELKLAERTMKDAKNKLLHLTSYDVIQHNFKPNDAILNKLKENKSLGTLTQKTIHIKSRQTSHLKEFIVKTSKDEHQCWITGMTSLTPDLLIMTDYNNKAIKNVDISSQSVTDQLQLDAEPIDITRVTSTEVAVTLPIIETIQFISISSNKLTKNRTMKVGGKCYGVSCHQSKLVVSNLNPAKLKVLDMNGSLLIEIDGKNIFKHPWYVKTNSSSIYVSDSKMKTVTRLNWQGEVTGSYGGTNIPRTLALTGYGTVFVCDSERNVIEELSGDCSTGEVVLKDLNQPHAVCWCTKTCKLYFSCHDFLQIYKLS